MLLALDVGNSHVKAGLFDGETLRAHWRVATHRRKLADEYGTLLLSLFQAEGIDPGQVRGCVIGSVVPVLTRAFRSIASEYFGVEPVVVGPEARTGIHLRGEPLPGLGADRAANCVALLTQGRAPGIAVALGTATAIDVIDADGGYLGGSIAPGLSVSAEALYTAAAMLHQVELVAPGTALGTTTVTQMQGGLIYGFAGLVEGLVRRMHRELGRELPVVATGGLAGLLAAEIPLLGRVEPHLTLEGLRAIHRLNRP